jgi:hypothetical protein
MDARAHEKRRMQLLKRLAKLAKGRHDAPIPISEISDSLTTKGFSGGWRFVDLQNPSYEGGSEAAYDFNTLKEDKLIEMAHIGGTLNGYGSYENQTPCAKVTLLGFDTISESDKSWLTKAIDKQPMTFVQILITVLAGIGGWAIGRYITPNTPQQTTESVAAPSQSGDVDWKAFLTAPDINEGKD